MTSKTQLAFKALDKNSDGFLSKREFNEISKSLTKEQVNRLQVLHEMWMRNNDLQISRLLQCCPSLTKMEMESCHMQSSRSCSKSEIVLNSCSETIFIPREV